MALGTNFQVYIQVAKILREFYESASQELTAPSV